MKLWNNDAMVCKCVDCYAAMYQKCIKIVSYTVDSRKTYPCTEHRIPLINLASSRELLQASTRYLPDNRPEERREGDLHYNFNRKSLPERKLHPSSSRAE